MSTITWDEVNKGSGVTLSNNNLTARVVFRSVAKTNVGKKRGKWYWEISIDYSSDNGGVIGILDDMAPLDNIQWNDGYTRFYYGLSGLKYPGASSYGSSFGTGDVISVLLDLDNGILEFWKNGQSQGVCFTNIKDMTGFIYPMVTQGYGSGNNTNGYMTVTASFRKEDMKYDIPDGYMAYDSIDKYLILSDFGEIESISGHFIKSISSQTEQDFINYGMDDLSTVNFKSKFKQKQYVQNESQALGSGKVFSHTVNFDKYIINKVEIQ